MTDLIVKTNRKSEALWKAQDLLALELAWGMAPEEALDVLSKGDKKKRTMWRRRLQRWSNEDEFQRLVASYVKGLQVLNLGATVAAMHRRAIKGNIPAVKLALETSGYWSPRHSVEHTGEVAITLKGVVRPAQTQDDAVVTDAEVVND